MNFRFETGLLMCSGLVAISGCTKEGTPGAMGAMGVMGTPGQSVSVFSLDAGDANCALGGLKFVSASGTAFACNASPGQPGPQGTMGTMGTQGMPGVSVTGAVVGAGDLNCPTGGTRLTSANGDTYVCNGPQGAPGLSFSAAALDAGDPTCPYGGVLVFSDAGSTAVCNGAPGVQGVVGPQGPQGPPGDAGPQGPQGIQGASLWAAKLDAGDPRCALGGALVYSDAGSVAVCNGAQGVQGIQGIQGVQGIQGIQGIQGVPGAGAVVQADSGILGDGSNPNPLAVNFAGSGTASSVARSDHTHPQYQLADAGSGGTTLGGKTLAQIECQARLGSWTGSACTEFATVGCDGCAWTTALAACPAGRHMCTSVELQMGAFFSFIAQIRYGTLVRAGTALYVWGRGYDPAANQTTTGNQMWYPWAYETGANACASNAAPMYGFSTINGGSGNATGAMGCYLKTYTSALGLCCLDGAY